MLKIGTKLVAERKALILAASTNKDTKVSSKDLDGRDLLTLLMKANMASDIPESQKLSDEEVVSRELFAGFLSGEASHFMTTQKFQRS